MQALSIRRRTVSSASTEPTNALGNASKAPSSITSLAKTAITGEGYGIGAAEQKQVGGDNDEAIEQVKGDGIEKRAKKEVQEEVFDDVQSSMISQKFSLRKQTTLAVEGGNNKCNNSLDNSAYHNQQLDDYIQAGGEPSRDLTKLAKGNKNHSDHLEFASNKTSEQQQRATGVRNKSSSLVDALIRDQKSWFEERTIIVGIRNTCNSKKFSQINYFDGRNDSIKNKASCKEKIEIVKNLEQDLEKRFDFLGQINSTNYSKINTNNKFSRNLKDKKNNYSTKLASKSSNQINNKTLSANNNHSNSSSSYTRNRQASSSSNNNNNNSIRDQISGDLISLEEKSERTYRGQQKLNEENNSRNKEKEQQTIDCNLDNKRQDTYINESNRRIAEDRQQVGVGKLIGLTQASKGKTPPTFGGTPNKVSRLPYYSYYGRARNVDLITAADREERLNRAGKSTKQKTTSGGYISGSQSDSSNSLHSSSGEPSKSSSPINTDSSSVSATNSAGKVPTLSRTSGYRDSRQINDLNEDRINKSSGQYNDKKNKETIVNKYSKSRKGRILKNGFSNISNLISDQQMNNYYSNRAAADQQRELNRQLKFNSAELSAGKTVQQQHQQPWNSSSNLNQASRVRSAVNLSRFAPSSSSRRNSISNYQNTNNLYTRPNRSMNSLNTSPYSNISDSQLQQSTMRRQNSNSAYGSRAKQRGSSYQGRPMSASGAYTSRHHRSPSSSSLHYGSAGMSPYGPPPVDPDCPVHGYSPVNQVHSKSSQHLASVGGVGGGGLGVGGGGSDGDLLYEPYNVGYYDRGASSVVPGGSLYSPTSPPLIDRPQTAAGAGYGVQAKVAPAAGGRLLSAANGNPNAYYNNTSRFSMYHSPMNGLDNVRSTLAPPNEQLRRILGYQPHTRPIYLHPQWAYSRPFIHLQGTRSPSPAGVGDDDDIIGPGAGDIRPRFEQYNQLHDTQAIRAVDFHPSGEVYAVGSNSRALRICAYPADYELRHFSHDHVTTAPRILFKFLQVHRGSIYCVSFNSTGQLLATGSNDQTVHIVRYNSITHSPDGDEYRLTMHDGTVRDLCFIDDSVGSNSSLLLSAGGGDNKIYVTDCDTITPFQSMAGHTQMIMALHHWGGSNFVSASYDRTIRFWDLRTRACTSIISAPPSQGGSSGKWAGPGAPVCAVKVDQTGRLLASGHNDSTCMLYDIRGARIIQAFKPHDDEIRTVSFSPKSYYLLTGGYDGRIVLTDIQGDLTQPLPSVCVAESDDKIVQSKWHPSDFTFVTTSADKTATLWAMPTE